MMEKDNFIIFYQQKWSYKYIVVVAIAELAIVSINMLVEFAEVTFYVDT